MASLLATKSGRIGHLCQLACFKASAEAFKQNGNAFSISGRAVSKVFLRGLSLKTTLVLMGWQPPPHLAIFISERKNNHTYIYMYVCVHVCIDLQGLGQRPAISRHLPGDEF